MLRLQMRPAKHWGVTAIQRRSRVILLCYPCRAIVGFAEDPGTGRSASIELFRSHYSPLSPQQTEDSGHGIAAQACFQ